MDPPKLLLLHLFSNTFIKYFPTPNSHGSIFRVLANLFPITMPVSDELPQENKRTEIPNSGFTVEWLAKAAVTSLLIASIAHMDFSI